MANSIDWGEGVLNVISWGADGQINGLEVTNLLAENGAFLFTESDDILVTETTFNAGGFGAAYDFSWGGETLLER
jgi:hypothetical protein